MGVGYRLGTYAGGVGGLQYLEDLGFTTLPFPSPYKPWSAVYTVANGATYGDGLPYCEWRFSRLTKAEMDILLGYIGAGNQSALVCLSTKDDTDTWLDLSGYAHRPNYPNEGDRRPGRLWRNVVFKFTQLESL